MVIKIRGLAPWALVAGLGLSCYSHSPSADFPLRVAGEQRIPAARTAAGGQTFIFFDETHELRHWTAAPSLNPWICSPGTEPRVRDTVFYPPRVDYVQCIGAETQSTSSYLVGLDESGDERWRRSLASSSGGMPMGESVIGASPDGVVLSPLRVISPATGEVLFEPPARIVRDPSSGKELSWPKHRFFHRALPLPSKGVFLVSDFNVTLTEREGGLYRLDTTTGQRELMLPVSTTWLGGYWTIEDMLISRDERYLYLAQVKTARRGRNLVSFSIFDISNRQVVFERKLGGRGGADYPKLTLGPKGSVGISFYNRKTRETVVIHYERLD